MTFGTTYIYYFLFMNSVNQNLRVNTMEIEGKTVVLCSYTCVHDLFHQLKSASWASIYQVRELHFRRQLQPHHWYEGVACSWSCVVVTPDVRAPISKHVYGMYSFILPSSYILDSSLNFYFFAFLAISSDLRVLLTLHSAVDIAVIIVVLVLPLSESINIRVIGFSLEPKKQNFWKCNIVVSRGSWGWISSWTERMSCRWIR